MPCVCRGQQTLYFVRHCLAKKKSPLFGRKIMSSKDSEDAIVVNILNYTHDSRRPAFAVATARWSIHPTVANR